MSPPPWAPCPSRSQGASISGSFSPSFRDIQVSPCFSLMKGCFLLLSPCFGVGGQLGSICPAVPAGGRGEASAMQGVRRGEGHAGSKGPGRGEHRQHLTGLCSPPTWPLSLLPGLTWAKSRSPGFCTSRERGAMWRGPRRPVLRQPGLRACWAWGGCGVERGGRLPGAAFLIPRTVPGSPCWCACPSFVSSPSGTHLGPVVGRGGLGHTASLP